MPANKDFDIEAKAGADKSQPDEVSLSIKNYEVLKDRTGADVEAAVNVQSTSLGVLRAELTFTENRLAELQARVATLTEFIVEAEKVVEALPAPDPVAPIVPDVDPI